MPLFQIFVAKDTVDESRRAAITRELIAEVLEVEGAPDTPAARSINWVLWHEIDEWWVGTDRVDASDAPFYLVRVETPAASLEGESKRERIIERVTAVLAKTDDDPDRLSRESVAWVLIDEVPEGNWGSRGHVIRYEDIKAYLARSS